MPKKPIRIVSYVSRDVYAAIQTIQERERREKESEMIRILIEDALEERGIKIVD